MDGRGEGMVSLLECLERWIPAVLLNFLLTLVSPNSLQMVILEGITFQSQHRKASADSLSFLPALM